MAMVSKLFGTTNWFCGSLVFFVFCQRLCWTSLPF